MSIFEGINTLASWQDPDDRGRDTCLDALKVVHETLKTPEEQYVI